MYNVMRLSAKDGFYMKYKLIAIDMDGTLLTDRKSISKENIDALSRASQKGLEIVVATGRSYSTLKPYLKFFPFDTYLITNNGAIIRNKEHSIIQSYELENSVSLRIIELLRRFSVYFHCSDKEFTYIDNYRARFIETKRFISQETKNPFRLYPKVLTKTFLSKEIKSLKKDLALHENRQINAFFIMGQQPDVLNAIKQALEEIPSIGMTSSSKDNIEILHENASKGNALSIVGEKLKISLNEMVAIGDQLNDLSMIKSVGAGVAMGNADQAVLKEAKFKTKTNEENGVASFINELLD